MDVLTQDKVNELVDLFASSLKIECQRLYNSGMINLNDYDKNYYPLARVLLTAAIHRMKNDFAPSENQKNWLGKDIINLINL